MTRKEGVGVYGNGKKEIHSRYKNRLEKTHTRVPLRHPFMCTGIYVTLSYILLNR